MKKTQEELNQLKQEYEALMAKLEELSDEELELVTGGVGLSESGTDTPQDIPGLEVFGPALIQSGRSVKVNEVLTSWNNKPDK